MGLENLDIVSILDTGVTGFALLMLYLGYSLSKGVQDKLLDSNLNDMSDSALKTWERVAGKQLLHTRAFMVLSLAFFLGGLGILFANASAGSHAPSAILLRVDPLPLNTDEDVWFPEVFHQGNNVELDTNGWSRLVVDNEQNLTIDNQSIMPTVARLMEGNRRLAIASTRESDDVGF